MQTANLRAAAEPSAAAPSKHPSAIDPRESKLDVTETQRAAVFDQKGGPALVREVPVQRDLNRGEVLVRIIYSGVCHTDLHAMLGDWPLESKLPLVGGHEGAGVVVALGEGSDEYVQLGDRVGCKWLADSCLNCDMCRRGFEANCDKAKASIYMCAGVTIYKAFKEANLGMGQYCAIPGAGGGLGHLAIQYAVAASYRVIAIDTDDEKSELCRLLGADVFIDFKKSDDIVECVRRATPDGRGPHAAIVAASGGGAYQEALDYLRPRGTLVAVGLPKGTCIEAPVFPTVVRGLRIVGSYVGNRQDAIEALDVASSGKVRAHFKTLGLSDLPKIYEDMQQGRMAGRVLVDIDK